MVCLAGGCMHAYAVAGVLNTLYSWVLGIECVSAPAENGRCDGCIPTNIVSRVGVPRPQELAGPLYLLYEDKVELRVHRISSLFTSTEASWEKRASLASCWWRCWLSRVRICNEIRDDAASLDAGPVPSISPRSPSVLLISASLSRVRVQHVCKHTTGSHGPSV